MYLLLFLVLRGTNTIKLYGDIPALLVQEDLVFPSDHYIRHERVPE